MKALPLWPIAWTFGTFAAAIFAFDILLGVLFPDWWVMQKIYEVLMPGFKFISWGAFFLGLLQAFVGGFWVAVLFVPIYNFFARLATNKRVAPSEPIEQQH